MEICDIFYDHLTYFVAICFILGQMGVFCGHTILHYPNFGKFYKEKSGNPAKH
jgi:hypothetical protein